MLKIEGIKMNKFIKSVVLLLLVIFTASDFSIAAAVKTAPQKAPVAKAQSDKAEYQTLRTPTILVVNPYPYLNKNVQFPAKFNKFSTLGLDYTPAMRKSQEYIGVLIDRDDVGNNVIPLSELKMFMHRKAAEKFTDLNAGDSIMIKGKVFSTALGDPWLDIHELRVLAKKPDNNKK